MTEFNHQPPPGDVLDRAAAAVRGQAIPAPPADLAAATVAAVHNRLSLAEAADAARRRRRAWVMRGIGVGGLAACLAVAVTWGGHASAAETLRVALENQEKAKSVRAVVKTTLAAPPAGAPPMPEQKLFLQGEHMRMEQGDTVTVSDGNRLVLLDSKAKVARTMDLPAEPGETAKGVMVEVQKVVDAMDGKGKVEAVPAVEIGGKQRPGYRVSGVSYGPGMTAEVTYYLDADKKLPVRFVSVLSGPVKLTSTTDYLGFDEELDPKLFSLDIPDGYKREELKLPAAPKEKEPAPSPPAEQLAEKQPRRERTRPVSLTVAAEAMAAAPCMVVTNTQRLHPQRPDLAVRLLVRGKQFRMEFLPPGGGEAVGAMVIDPDQERSLHLDFTAKSAKFETRRGPKPGTVPDLVAGFRQLKDEDGEAAGEEQVGDVTARVFKLKSAAFIGAKGATATVWLDPATSLPVKVVAGDGTLELRFEKFEWPAKLDDTLFSLTPPKGYTVSEFVPPAAAPGKK